LALSKDVAERVDAPECGARAEEDEEEADDDEAKVPGK
jgi:hypothetical protein